MGQYSIREISALSGIKPHTIRIWEQRYGIIDPLRTDTNIRYYTDKQLKYILNISFLNHNGFKISAIAKMSHNEVAEQVNRLSLNNFEFENQIQALNIAMVELNEKRFEKIISTNIIQFGFELCMINIVFPFMEKIGSLWCTGAINPAHEHFITNLVRQKLIVAIDGIIPEKNEHSKNVVLFLPEGEFHEIGLLFTNYLFKKRNHNVIYLGSIPFEDLAVVSKVRPPEILFTIMTLKQMKGSDNNFVSQLSEQFSDCQIYITGLSGMKLDKDLWENVTILEALSDAVVKINEISGINTITSN